MYTEISYDESDHIGVITIDRPEARNALTHTTYAELADAVERTTARCLIVTGADPAFCSGDDVKQVMLAAGSDGRSGERPSPRLTPAAGVLLRTDVPVVVAVNGAAVGWGMELALMADIRVASERARFGELFVKRGLCSDVAGLARLAQLVGREHAVDLLLTGRIIDAHEARDLRLVSEVVERDQLDARVEELAATLAGQPTASVQLAKEAILEAPEVPLASALRADKYRLFVLSDTEEKKASHAAFASGNGRG
jgi:enoyl-CoA hydratase